jgi:hypothetical protein
MACERVEGMRHGGGRCVALEPIDCDDGDPCTTDECNPETAGCTYAPSTFDLDGDGHLGPLSGKLPGEPDACGDDCDDTSALAFPGSVEECDGVDNDCNGIVDDNASFIPLQDAPLRISGDIAPAVTGGLAWSGTSYAAIYGGTNQGFDVYETTLSSTGEPIDPGERRLTTINADSSGGPVVWIGDRYGVAWQDRRDGDYEIYFSLLKDDGSKVIADTRVSSAYGFSVNVALGYDGQQFVLTWQDARNGPFDIYAQRISIDGELIGDNMQLTNTGLDNESPTIAAGLGSTGIAWSGGDFNAQYIEFQAFDHELAPLAEPVAVTDGQTEAVFPTIAWNKGHDGKPGTYVIAWFDRTASPAAVYGTVVKETGETVVAPRALTNPGVFRSRYPTLRPLGDRVLLIYSDDRDQNDGYELYARMVSDTLEPMGVEQRLTDAPKDSIYPVTSFGPPGELGVLFRDDRLNGNHHVYFMRLGCVAAP